VTAEIQQLRKGDAHRAPLQWVRDRV